MSTPPMDYNGDSDRVAEIRQRLEAATPGPWRRPAANVFRVVAPDQPHHNPPEGMTPPYPWRIVCDTGAEDTAAADAALIAAAPTDIEWLLSRLAVVEAERDELRGKLDRTWREATPAFQRLHAALDETGREVEAPAGDDLWRYGWAEGYTVACTTLRRVLSGTTEGPS